MKIRDLFGKERPVFSFEFFPPKDEAATEALYRTVVQDLKPLAPSFVSVTYGAGGSTRDRTLSLVGRIQNDLGIPAMAHLTCVGATRDETGKVLDRLAAMGIVNVLALRGDPPKGETAFTPMAGGFRHASELAVFVKARGGFSIGGACYPEGHVECRDLALGLEHLKLKVAAGAEFLITQLFFDNADYFRFVASARAAGISVPIVPGIMPVGNLEQVKRFTAMCGARIPDALLKRLEADPAGAARIGIEHATGQCRDLLARGAPGIHFYTLNKSAATREIFGSLR